MINSPTNPTETSSAYGLFPAGDFVVTTGSRAGRLQRRDCATVPTLPQALWFFRSEVIAVPRPGVAVAGFDPFRLAIDDVRAWSAATSPGSACDRPGVIWLGAPDVVRHARIVVDEEGGERLLTPEGAAGLELAPRLADNRAFYNADSAAFFARRVVHLRGEWHTERVGRAASRRFVARSFWPDGYRLDAAAPLRPIPATSRALRDFVREVPHGGASGPFVSRLVWQRAADSSDRRAGRPLIALMLNGAQGDDDEAHGGHFALVTGRVGPAGEMHDWLVANFYTLATESEKGIIAAMRPLEGYLGDLNSGQAWYRPSYLLVATLRDERTAEHLASALGRIFNQFYRNPTGYDHAGANCTGISISTLRALGWQVPALGATSWMKAIVSLPAVTLATGSLRRGKESFDYLTEDRTRLLPALAFEQAGADLLRLVGGQAKRALTPFEAMLAADVEEILLVRVPQFPSSRAWGDFPVASIAEYRRRLPKNPAERQIIPVAPRPFPPELADPGLPRAKPSRSDYAVATGAVVLLTLGVWAVRVMRRQGRSLRGGNDEGGRA